MRVGRLVGRGELDEIASRRVSAEVGRRREGERTVVLLRWTGEVVRLEDWTGGMDWIGLDWIELGWMERGGGQLVTERR